MSELKACPFCGVVPELETQHTIGVFYFYKCPNCAVSGGLGFDKNEAKNYWNTRPLEDALSARVQELEAKIARLQSENEWIPVSERLPTEKDCPFDSTGKLVPFVQGCVNGKLYGLIHLTHFCDNRYYTHWKSIRLPQPRFAVVDLFYSTGGKGTKMNIQEMRNNIFNGAWTISDTLVVLNELDRLQQESRWIPVSERLPETNKRVEFFGGFEQTTHIGYYREHATQWESENGGFWHGRNFALVTHWRPISAPEVNG